MPVSLDKSVKLNCAFQSGNPPFLRTRRLKSKISAGKQAVFPDNLDFRLILLRQVTPARYTSLASCDSTLRRARYNGSPQRWSPPTRNVRVTNHLCPHSRKVVYSPLDTGTRKNKMFEEHLSLFIRAPVAAAQDVATEWSNPDV